MQENSEHAEHGADVDALAKAIAREIIAQLRQARALPTLATDLGEIVRVGPLAMHTGRREVTVNGKPIALQRREFDLLLALARAPGHALTRDQLLQLAWPADAHMAVYDRTVDTQVSRLRRKLGEHDDLVVTIPTVGYKLAEPVD